MDDTLKFVGKWNVWGDDRAFDGTLYVNEKVQSLVLELILPAKEDDIAPDFPYRGKIPFIHGELINGTPLTLYQCETGQIHQNLMAYTQQVVYVNYAFWNLRISDETDFKFCKTIVDFGEIIEWVKLCKFRSDLKNDGSVSMDWNQSEPVEFSASEKLKIKFIPRLRKHPALSFECKIELEQWVAIELTYDEAVTIEEILSDIYELQQLISFGMNSRVAIKQIYYFHPSNAAHYDDITIDQEAELLLGSGREQKPRHARFYEYLFSFKELAENGAKKFTWWCVNYQKLKPVLDLYMAGVKEDVNTPEMYFLNLAQACETFHARFYAKTPAEYKARVQKLLDDFFNGDINSENAQNWRKKLLGCEEDEFKQITLKCRLEDLFFSEGEIVAWGRPYTNPEKIKNTRNYYTHYNEDKKTGIYNVKELPYVNACLKAVLNYHIMRLMGFDKTETANRTRKRMAEIEMGYSLQENSIKIKK